MQENLNGFRVGGQDNHFADTTVERLGGLVGSLFDLLVIGSLLDEIQQGNGKVGIGQGKCFFRHDCSSSTVLIIDRE